MLSTFFSMWMCSCIADLCLWDHWFSSRLHVSTSSHDIRTAQGEVKISGSMHNGTDTTKQAIGVYSHIIRVSEDVQASAMHSCSDANSCSGRHCNGLFSCLLGHTFAGQAFEEDHVGPNCAVRCCCSIKGCNFISCAAYASLIPVQLWS